MYEQTVASCEEHPRCLAITGPGWVSHAVSDLHVECRTAPGTTAKHGSKTIKGRDGMCVACRERVGV